MVPAALFLLSLLELATLAAEPTPWIETPLPPDVPVVIDESDLKAKLATLGSPDTVALVVTTKGQETRLVELLGDARYRYLRAGSSSEAAAPLRASGLACGVFLAPQGSDHWRAKAIGTCAGNKPAEVAAVPVPASAPTAPTAAAASAAASPASVPPAIAPTIAAPSMDLAAFTAAQKDLLRLETSLPSPTAATLLSALVGFGSGHYYAGSPDSAQVHLVVQILGVVAIGVGSALASDPDSESVGQVVGAIGIAGFGIDRIVEAANAPFKAHQTSARILASGDPRLYDAQHTF